ncbi:MAG: hypothetical protein WBQ27_01790 [Thermoanaerobaculia bacterium]
MNRSLLRALLLLLVWGVLIWLWVGRNQHERLSEPSGSIDDSEVLEEAANAEQVEPKGDNFSPGFTVITSRPPPRPGIPASTELLGEARDHLDSGGQEGSCGRYSLIGDTADPVLLESCNLLASELDDTYAKRLGVIPLGDPVATIILFNDRQAYWDFSEQQGLSAPGYAAHSKPSRGYTAIWADSRRPEDFAKTLVHELTHLVNRRALGGNLPRWLSEGLADALGDTATPAGIQQLQGLEGAEGQAERLRLAYETEQVPSVARLVTLGSKAFDGGAVSYDYEQSALLVRYLLLDPELASRFRGFLADLAGGAPSAPELLQQRQTVEWAELDHRLQSWLGVRPALPGDSPH